jgi:LPS sulfotransferase NodH
VLCEALTATGVAGEPREEFEQLSHSGLRRKPREYFAGLADPSVGGLLPEEPADLGEPLPGGPYADHVAAAIVRGTTSNGVFGTKLMWGHLDDFLARTRGDLDATFGDPAYVIVQRRDKLRQAISLWRAVQTQSWRRDSGGASAANAEPVFSAAAIAHLRGQLAEQEAAWGEFLAGRGPLVLVYEDLAADLGSAVRAVLAHVGIEAPADLDVAVPMRRQSDALTEEWVDRFEREAA